MMKKKERRRGAALENALLEAAIEELIEVGYPRFTMDGVATRARTSRPVLYRRWPNRASLALAAIKHYYLMHPVAVPDLGNLREEMTAVLLQSTARGANIQVKVVLQLGDYFSETGSTVADLRNSLGAVEENSLNIVIERAIKRGEIDPKKLTPRIRSLPADWARNEVMITFKAVSRQAVAEFLDEIFLPLVGHPRKAEAS